MLDVRRGILNDYHYHLVYQHTEIHDEVLSWLSSIPLSRPIWDIGEDFADGILTADILFHYVPEFIDMNRIHEPKNMAQRTANWHYLSNESLPKLGINLPYMLTVDLSNGVHRAAEIFLLQLRTTILQYITRSQQASHQQQPETLNLLTGGQQRLPQIQGTPRQGAIAAGKTGANGPGSNSNNQAGNKNTKQSRKKGTNATLRTDANSSRAPNTNSSVVTSSNASGTNYNCGSLDPSLAPCREALRLKDKEISELQEKVNSYEKLLREKMKVYEKLLRTKDDRIQELEKRLGNEKMKRPKP